MGNSNDLNLNTTNNNLKNDLLNLKVNIKGFNNCDMNDTFMIRFDYLKEEKIKNIFNKIRSKLNKKYHPLKLKFYYIEDVSFTGESFHFNQMENKSITEYDLNDITKKGLSIEVEVRPYHHKIKCVSIDCEYMNKANSIDATKCPIYYAMKQKYEWNQNHLNHLNEYTHFEDEYNDKPQCRYFDECKSYIRSENGGNHIKDQCHLKLYRHPPRKRNIKLQQNIHAFIINKNKKENHEVFRPTKNDEKQYKYNEKDEFLNALIEEVIANGFKNDLCLLCAPQMECKHNDYSILTIVDDKIEHIRHKAMNKPLNRAQMLSLVLYTGCECNYDLCAAQRNGDYKKWKWFDYCLYWAIRALSERERGSFPLYSGLSNVKLSTKSVQCGYFRTYVSSSWNQDVALTFMSGSGMVINIDKEFKNGAYVRSCDVSWISKFPDECEVLFARSRGWYDNFECIVVDDSNDIQSVSLIKD